MSRKQVAHRFKVVFEPEPDGSAWNASIPAIQGCVTYGRSLGEARRNIREALSLFEEEFEGKADEVAAAAVFEEDIRVPGPLRVALRRFARLRSAESALQAQKAELARVITETYSLRDAGELLGMSPEGVRKLVRGVEGPATTSVRSAPVNDARKRLKAG